jgi:hypothetical protein
MNDEFYVGYADESPPGLRRFQLRALGVAVVLAVVFLAILASAFSPAAPGTFEFGIRRTYEGQLLEGPLPLLRSVAADGTVTHRLLVGAGKHGLPAFARGHHGETVRFEGTRIESGRLSLVEMNAPESFRVLDPAPGPLPPVRDMEVGEVLLEGELVDTKCWAGVMRPATGKVHRACAIVCLRGGVPPGLLVRDGAGNAVVVLLVGTGGRPLDLDPRLAARVLRVSGRLAFQGEVPRLEVAHVSLVIP